MNFFDTKKGNDIKQIPILILQFNQDCEQLKISEI
jgi:hypothetical protein